jgi:hypothetical protein
MANVSRLLATWQGFPGAPGYSRFSFSEITTQADANTAGNSLHAFFNSLATMFHTNWTITINSLVENYDVATGRLMNEIVMSTVPSPVAGSALATTPYVGGSGAVVHWLTGFIWNGRRVRGRTFLAPLVGVGDTDGTLDSTHLATIQSAANALMAAGPPTLSVWAKQFSATTPPIQNGGSLAPVDSVLVPDKAALMRSRRD